MPILISTEFPDAILRLATTPASVIAMQPDGRVLVSGAIAITLLGTMSSTATLPRGGMLLGPLDPRTRAHPLESMTSVDLSPSRSKVTTNHGPSLFVRKWNIAKQTGQPTAVKLKRYAMWLSNENLGPAIPDSHSFQLLIPTTDQSGTWTYSNREARLLKSAEGAWVFEVVAMLMFGGTGLPALDFELPAVMANQTIKLYLNSPGATETRLHLHLGVAGDITGLLMDAPAGRSGFYPLQLGIPPTAGLQVSSVPSSGAGMISVERIWFAQGRCEANLSRDARVEFGFGQCARLGGAGAAFSFNVKLPRGSHWTRQIREVSIEASTLGIASVHASAQFDGLRIDSLNSTGRKDEVLDAAAPVITIQLGYGTTVPFLVSYSEAWLGPRETQRSHDGLDGVLDLPITGALLRIARNGGQRGGKPSPLRYQARMAAATRKWEGNLEIQGASMLLPPLASAARLADSAPAMSQGSTRADYLVKHLPASRRIQAVHRDAAPRIELAQDWFRQWDLDRRNTLHLHDLGDLHAQFESVEFKLAPPDSSVRTASARNDGLGYAALTMILGYVAGAYRGSEWAKLFDKALRVELDEATLAAWVEVNGLENLLFMADVLKTDVAQQKWWKKFVLANLGQSGPEPMSDILWPFAPALGIALVQTNSTGQRQWLWDLVRTGTATACKVAFDFSATTCIDPKRMGLDKDFLKTEPSLRPLLWPRSRAKPPPGGPAATQGSVTDPAVPEWQGVFFADLPLAIGIDAKPGTLLGDLRDSINRGLRLRYGWLDAGGHTWLADWTPDGSGARLYPPLSQEDPMCELFMDGFESTGSQGQLASAKLDMRLRINPIKSTSGGVTKPAELKGEADLKFIGGEKSKCTMLPNDTSAFSTDSLPGFDKLALLRFETDFDTASIDVSLIPSQALVALIPYFDRQEVQAKISVPVSGAGEFDLSVRLPAEAPTRLFGKWPIGVRGYEFVFDKDQKLPAETRFMIVLDLGIPYIKRVGGTLTIKHELDSGGAVQLGMKLDFDEFEIELPLLGLTLRGMLQWRDPGHTPSPAFASSAELLAAPADRDLYAYVSLDGLVQAQRQDFYLRISSAARPFWIATLINRSASKVAGTRVDDAGLLLAYGAQLKSDGELANVIANPASVGRSLFPRATDKPVDWLDKWEPAASARAVTVGLMGSFGLDPILASADGKDNLALVWSDTGLFYGQTKLKLLTQIEARLRLMIDFRQRFLTASLQLPASPMGGGVEVSPGCLSVSLSWGKSKGIGLALGYPPLMKDPLTGDYVPDWSQAISVRIAGAWPINTFQGGVKAYYFSEPDEQFGFGVAIRAGYSNSFKVTGSDIADARADVGVMIGGTFQFCRGGPAPAMPQQLFLSERAAEGESWLKEELLRLADSLLRADPLRVSALIVGDVWGHASVVFLGVTIAGVNIDARALFTTRGTLDAGIQHMAAAFTFNVSVKIGCTRFHTSCRFDIVMINKAQVPAGDCNPLLRELRARALTLDEEMQ